MIWYDMIGYIFFLILFVIFFKSCRKKKENKWKYDELLRFFEPDEKLIVAEVAERIKERTEGRRDVSGASLFKALAQLVEEGKLIREETPAIIYKGGIVINRVLYFLPKNSK